MSQPPNSDLAEGISSEVVFQSIIHEAVRTCGAERGFLMLDASNSLASFGPDRGGYSRPLVKIICQTAQPQRRLVPYEERRAGATSSSKQRSVIAAPLLADGVREGVLYLDAEASRAFSENDLTTLVGVAEQAALSFKLALQKRTADKQRRADPSLSALERDELTGVATKQALVHRLQDIFTQPDEFPSSLLLLELDHFTHYLARHGRPAGNELMKRIGLLLESSLRSYDLAAYYQEQTFAVVLHRTPLDGALSVAERLRVAIHLTDFPFGTQQPGGRVSLSLGVAALPQHGSTPEQLLSAAQTALLTAAEEKNQVVTAQG